MTRKTTRREKRWKRRVSDQVARPKKPELLAEIAEEYLGPFKYRTQEQALADGRANEDFGTRLGISRELALELIEDIARRFNEEMFLCRDAPRLKDVVNNLIELQQMAAAFAAKLSSLDDLTRHVLAEAAKGQEKKLQQLMTEADVASLPAPEADERDPCAWVTRLDAISSYFDAARGCFQQQREKQGRQLKDVGGNTNLWKEEAGSPRWGLVYDALQIYEMFHPEKAKATVGGKFHEFVLQLFEYTTGREGADHAKIDDWVKKLVKVHRDEKQLRLRQLALDAECEEIAFRATPAHKSDREKIGRNMTTVGAIARQRARLWRIMYPHLRNLPD
jgi:hypothetical protein